MQDRSVQIAVNAAIVRTWGRNICKARGQKGKKRKRKKESW